MSPWRPVLLSVALALAAPAVAGALTWQPPLLIPGPDVAPSAVPAPDGVFLVGSEGSVRDVPVGGPVPEVAESVGEPTTDNGFPLAGGASAGSARDGELVIVYTRRSARPRVYRRVRVVFRSPAGQWTTPLALSTPGRTADYARVAVAPDGSAVAAWLRHDADGRWHLQYATRPADGGFRTPTTVPGDLGVIPAGTVLGVAAAPGGGGLVTWRARRPSATTMGSIYGLPVAANGSARPILTLADPSAGDSYGVSHDRVSVAYAADRTATLVWVVARAANNVDLAGDRVVSAVLGRDGRLHNRTTLASLGGPAVGWGVAVGGSGTATATWAGYPSFGADAGEATATAWVGSRSAGGGWTKSRAVSAPGVHISMAVQRDGAPIVMDTAGGAVVVWAERTQYATSNQRVLSTARPAGGTWAGAQEVPLNAPSPLLAGLTATGEGHVALNVALPPSATQPPGRYLIFGDATGSPQNSAPATSTTATVNAKTPKS